jgi:hypothetical protein
MRKLSTKKLQVIHTVIADYDRENKDIVFNIPSLMKYCIENDIRKRLEAKRLRSNEINGILKSIDFDVYFKQLKTNKNSVKIKLNYSNFDSFENSYSRLRG